MSTTSSEISYAEDYSHKDYKCRCESEKSDACKSKICKFCPIDDIPAHIVACRYDNAVVEIHSEFILTGGSDVVNGESPLGPLSGDYQGRRDVILNGNGFFLAGKHIIAPAQLVLLPPSLTAVVNRYPYLENIPDDLGRIQNQMVRASRILVTVHNVNNCGKSYLYEANLVGVDGAGDIAVLEISKCSDFNDTNPKISSCHPHFSLGGSEFMKAGQKAYLMGDYATNAISDRRTISLRPTIIEAKISDAHHLERSGWVLPQMIVVDASVYSFRTGMPILDSAGRVIGMQTTNINEQGLVGGPSSAFMRPVLKYLINALWRYRNNDSKGRLEQIRDPLGNYFRYRKSYLGLAYDVFDGADYDYTVDYNPTALVAGRPRVRLDDNGNFLSSPSNKQLLGVRVQGIAGANPNDLGNNGGDPNVARDGSFYVPGGESDPTINGLVNPLPAQLPVSPFLGNIRAGDLITHISVCHKNKKHKFELGDLQGQIAPSLVTWKARPNTPVDIDVRRGGNSENDDNNSATENYQTCYTFKACTKEFPQALDYPWYAVSIFPSLEDDDFYEAGTGKELLVRHPAYIQLLAGAPFRPSL